MKYNFDEPINRRGTYSVKYDAGELLVALGLTSRFDVKTIPLFLADMDFQAPQPVLDALHRLIDQHRMFGYSSQIGSPEYYDAIIQWFKSRRGWQIQREEILYISGTVEALKQAILAYTQPGEGVIIQPPVYAPFASTIRGEQRAVVNNRLINQGGVYTMDYADLEAKASDPNNKLLVLCHPHNPVGRVWRPEELKQLADICLRHGVLIVSDEIHGDILRKGQAFHPLATLADNRNLVTFTAINKTFNLAGLQCTNVVIPDPELRQKYAQTMGFSLPTPFAVAALIAAYTEGADWLEQVNDYIDGNIDGALGFLNERMPRARCTRPEGTYILWVDLRGYGLSGADLRERIYQRANVVLETGVMFDPEQGEGFERICVPTQRAMLMEALERIAREFAD